MNWIVPTWVKYIFLVNSLILLPWYYFLLLFSPELTVQLTSYMAFIFQILFKHLMQLHFLVIKLLFMYHLGSFFGYSFNAITYSTLCLGNLNFIKTWWWWRNKNRIVLHTLESYPLPNLDGLHPNSSFLKQKWLHLSTKYACFTFSGIFEPTPSWCSHLLLERGISQVQAFIHNQFYLLHSNLFPTWMNPQF